MNESTRISDRSLHGNVSAVWFESQWCSVERGARGARDRRISRRGCLKTKGGQFSIFPFDACSSGTGHASPAPLSSLYSLFSFSSSCSLFSFSSSSFSLASYIAQSPAPHSDTCRLSQSSTFSRASLARMSHFRASRFLGHAASRRQLLISSGRTVHA